MKAIDRLILDETDEKVKKLLRKLKSLNLQAFQIMHGQYQTFFPKYRALQKTDIWFEARQILIQYFISQGIFKCPLCNSRLNFTRCVLHHKKYDVMNIFTPTFVQFVHNGCHADFHRKKK